MSIFVSELPLFRRELIELAQRKRNYVLRCLCMVIFSLIFLTIYAERMTSAYNLMAILGSGRDMTIVLFVSLAVTVYAIAPALACSAITAEKEKQTLGLMMISQLTPGTIILEKVFSRMLPLMTILTVSAPLFGLSYLLGGVTFEDSAWAMSVLMFAVVQVTVVSICCSAIFETGMGAFWATYVFLLLLYFTVPILVEMRILDRLRWFGGVSDEEFFLFPPYLMFVALENPGSRTDLLLMLLPSVILTTGLLFVAKAALIRFCYGSATSVTAVVRQIRANLESRLGWRADSDSDSNLAAGPDSYRRSDLRAISRANDRIRTMADRPVQWREEQNSGILSWRWIMVIGLLTAFLELSSVSASRRSNHNEICALFTFIVMIIALLAVIGVSCRLFARERDRQTLDTLLTLPLTSRQLINDKVQSVDNVIRRLMFLVFLTAVINLMNTRMRMPVEFLSEGQSPWGVNADWLSLPWFFGAVVYLMASLSFSFVYLHLVKWTGVLFGLFTKTQMQAVVGTLVSVLLLCFLPALLLALVMISVN
ncbi:MAG: ABC transporter permease subunit, partial [Planctomycetaceae bacterium]|nr:ABC transporter permease subunit [Planctomycetaceae bacterium]